MIKRDEVTNEALGKFLKGYLRLVRMTQRDMREEMNVSMTALSNLLGDGV